MRLLITTYQKCGTYQLYPMFANDAGHEIPQLVDHSYHTLDGLPEHLHPPIEHQAGGIEKTVNEFRAFKHRAFGHIPYQPEWVEALQSRSTKVIFAIRDPRDVIVSEHEYMKKTVGHSGRGAGLWNWLVPGTEKTVTEMDDPLAFLIESAFYRWQNWYGWLDHDFVMPVKYESLRLEKGETIEQIRQFLAGVPALASAAEMIERTKPTPHNRTFRKGAVGDWKIHFSDHHIELGKEFLNPVMERLGYEKDWTVE